MKTFATIITTILLVLSMLLGYSCGLESGFDWLSQNVQGWLGAMLFPAVGMLCLATGMLLGSAPAERRSKPREHPSEFTKEYWQLVRHLQRKPQAGYGNIGR